jgi:hypothetical protein
MKEKRLQLALLLSLALALAFWGQYHFARNREQLWDGLSLYVVAGLLFVVVLSRFKSQERRMTLWQTLSEQFWVAVGQSSTRLIILCLATAEVVGVSFMAATRNPYAPFWDLLALWVTGVAVAIASLLPWKAWGHGLRSRRWHWRAPSPETVAVALLALLTFGLRVFSLDTIPYVLSGDEASMGLESIGVLEGTRTSPFVTGWLSHPTLYFFLQACFLKTLGITAAGLRFSSALISGVIAILLYLFARRYWGRWVALLATLYFACYHYAIHFGRLGLNNIWDPFFALGVFLFLERGLRREQVSDFALAGLLLGLCNYFYMGARLIPIMLVAYLGYHALTDLPRIRRNLGNLIVCVLVAFLVAAPLVAYFRGHPSDLTARYKWVGIFPSGWVEQEMQRTGKSMLAVLWGQFLKAALAFNYYPDPTYWYRPGIPLLQFFPSVFFMLGLVYAMWHWRKPACFLLSLWFWAVIISGGALLENPPTSPRFVLAIPAVVLLMVLGMVQTITLLLDLLGKSHRWLVLGLPAVLILASSYASLNFYFVRYTPSNEFGGVNTLVADRMGKYLTVLGADYQCYFFGAPRMFYGFATIPYFARGIVGMDVQQPIQGPPDFVNPARKAVFVFLPERQAELDFVRQSYPNGRLREFREKGQFLFIAYEADG